MREIAVFYWHELEPKTIWREETLFEADVLYRRLGRCLQSGNLIQTGSYARME